MIFHLIHCHRSHTGSLRNLTKTGTMTINPGMLVKMAPKAEWLQGRQVRFQSLQLCQWLTSCTELRKMPEDILMTCFIQALGPFWQMCLLLILVLTTAATQRRHDAETFIGKTVFKLHTRGQMHKVQCRFMIKTVFTHKARNMHGVRTHGSVVEISYAPCSTSLQTFQWNKRQRNSAVSLIVLHRWGSPTTRTAVIMHGCAAIASLSLIHHIDL